MSTDSKQNEPGQSSGIFLAMLAKVGIQIKDGALVYDFKDPKALDQAIRLLKKGLKIRSIDEVERLEGATYLDVLEAYRALRQSSLRPNTDAGSVRSIETTDKFFILTPSPTGTNQPVMGATGESPMTENSEPKHSVAISDPPESTGMDPFEAARDVERQLKAEREAQPRHVAAAAIVDDQNATGVLPRPPSVPAPPDKIPGEDADDMRETRILDQKTDEDEDEEDEEEDEDEDEDLASGMGSNLVSARPAPVVAPADPPPPPAPPAKKPLPDVTHTKPTVAMPKHSSAPPPPDPADAAKTNVMPRPATQAVPTATPALLLSEHKPLPPPSIQPPGPLPPAVLPPNPMPSFSRVESDTAAAPPTPAPASGPKSFSIDVALSETSIAPSNPLGPAPVGNDAAAKPPVSAPLPAVIIAVDEEQKARAQQVVTPKPADTSAPAKGTDKTGGSKRRIPWYRILWIILGVGLITWSYIFVTDWRSAVVPKTTVKTAVCEPITAENLKTYIRQSDPHAFIDMGKAEPGQAYVDATKGKVKIVGKKLVYDVTGAQVCTERSVCIPVTPSTLQQHMDQQDPENFVDKDIVRPGKPFIVSLVALKPKGERTVYDLLVEPGVTICHF